MSFETTKALNGEVLIIKLPKRVAADVSDKFKEYIYSLVDNGHYKLVFDLSKTDYMDSSGLGALVARISISRANQGDIRLASVNSYINDLLELTHLNQILRSFEDLKSAVKSFEENLQKKQSSKPK